MMEMLSLDSIVTILGLLFGGGSLGGIFVWRYTRKQAEAEAKKAEAEAKKAEAEALKEKQDYYQQMADDLAKDRDYYKQERDEYRQAMKRYDERMDELERKVARNGRMVENMRPFMCADLGCKLRKRVVVSDDGEIKKGRSPQPKHEIEPSNED